MYVAFQIPTAEGFRGHFSQCQSLIYFGDFILIRRRCHNFHRLTRWWLVWRQLVIRLPIVVQLLNYRSMSTSITVPLQTRTQRVISIWAILRRTFTSTQYLFIQIVNWTWTCIFFQYYYKTVSIHHRKENEANTVSIRYVNVVQNSD